MARPDWMADALCAQVDPELWFPETGGSNGSAQAKAICNRCPVQAECLAYALQNHEQYGVWGATNERERRRMQRTCRRCGGPRSDRARYCLPCAKERRRETQQANQRKQRAAA